MSASQASDLLRDCLAKMCSPPLGSQELSSHSLKSTLLAWCARFGVKSSVRRQLGKHSDPRDRSMLVYSRDVSLAALSHVAALFRAIEAGAFDPDASRSIVLGPVSLLPKRKG
eukprot:5309421-Amphidinium_carterae.1